MNSSSVLNFPGFKTWLAARFLTNLAKQMEATIISWQVYLITKDAFALGLVGLMEALPFFVFALWAGHIADRHDRQKILLFSQSGHLVCALALFVMTFLGQPSVLLMYAVVAIAASMTSFEVASASAYVQSLIPTEHFPKAAAWNLTLFTTSMIVGPVLAGWIMSFATVSWAYGIAAIFAFASFLMIRKFRHNAPIVLPGQQGLDEPGWQRIKMGLVFIRSQRLLLASMVVDLFAVLFGGAVALFPIFAEILNVGPTGLGWLRAAPALGAVGLAFSQTSNAYIRPTWRALVLSVVAFGICMIGFALSPNIVLAVLFLIGSGAADSISVIIRSSIIQRTTPDHLRGRVSAVGSIFIRSSNEIGAFESGVAAKLMGTVPSVVFGGIMTLVTALVMKWMYRDLEKAEKTQKLA